MGLVDMCGVHLPVRAQCTVLGLSAASLYRACAPHVAPRSKRESAPRADHVRGLSAEERTRVHATLCSEEFVDQAPREVYGALLKRGIYLGSIRTMYRVLAEKGATTERRNQRAPHKHTKPSLTCMAPNQVWTWDITRLRTTTREPLFLYVILDLYSRFVVGWMVAEKECQHLAAKLFKEALPRHRVSAGAVVHSDRGAVMKSDVLGDALALSGVTRSFSRPRVSNDNAFSEAHFKTSKYHHDYPGEFTGALHARGYFQGFFTWYHDEHCHTALALYTPADVFFGRVDAVHSMRQAALDAAYAATPKRFPHGPPRAARPPVSVSINPVVIDTVALTSVEQPAPHTPTGEVLAR